MWEERVVKERRDYDTTGERERVVKERRDYDTRRRPRTPTRSRTPRESDTQRFCFFHSKYKDDARKCKPPCQWGRTPKPYVTTNKRQRSPSYSAYDEKRRKTSDRPDRMPEVKPGTKENEKAKHRAEETSSRQDQSQVLAYWRQSRNYERGIKLKLTRPSHELPRNTNHNSTT